MLAFTKYFLVIAKIGVLFLLRNTVLNNKTVPTSKDSTHYDNSLYETVVTRSQYDGAGRD